MKKILTLTIVFMFMITTMSFAAGSVPKTKIISLKGVIVVDKKSVKLKTPEVTYELIGKTKDLLKSNGRAVQIKGFVVNKKFNVQSYIYIRTSGTPTPPIKDNSSEISLVGMLTTNTIEGKHYELQVNDKIYVLVGNAVDLSPYTGKIVKITGYESKSQISIYQRGTLFNVKTVVLAPGTTTNEENVTLVGTVMIDKITGTHIGFKVGDTLYGLTGKTEGIEALDGQKVQLKGYAPRIVYIRKPDFIIFYVNEYAVAE